MSNRYVYVDKARDPRASALSKHTYIPYLDMIYVFCVTNRCDVKPVPIETAVRFFRHAPRKKVKSLYLEKKERKPFREPPDISGNLPTAFLPRQYQNKHPLGSRGVGNLLQPASSDKCVSVRCAAQRRHRGAVHVAANVRIGHAED